MRKVFIYALKDNDKIFYIGKTYNIERRLTAHIYESKKLIRPKDVVINNILLEKRKLTAIKLLECDKRNSNDLERDTIRKYVLNGFDLINKQHSFNFTLSRCDIEVLKLFIEDKRVSEISEILCRSPRTIENRVASLKRKLKCNTLHGLVSYVIINGLVIL